MVVLVSIDRKRSFVFDSLNCLYGKTNSLWRYIYMYAVYRRKQEKTRDRTRKKYDNFFFL